MPKKVYCAECGEEVFFMLKALPKQQMTITIIEPHICSKEDPKNPFKDINNELITKDRKRPIGFSKIFDKFKFSKKVGGDNAEPANILDKSKPKDNRPKEDLVNTIAPDGIFDTLKNMNPSTPENEFKE